MKKKTAVILAGLCALSLLGGCGKTTGSGTGKANESMEYNVEDHVTLGEYKGMEIAITEYTVTDEDVRNSIESKITTNPYYPAIDKTTVENGDVVNIDYEGTKDGVAFEGGTAAGHKLEIGSNSFIDGFEEGLIGAKVGDSLDLNLTFPENYQNEELAGQDVVFHVTVNSIVEKIDMTYDTMSDEYVSETFGYDSVKAFLDATKEYLTGENEYYEQSEKQEKVVERLKEICSVKLPEGLLDQRVKEYKEEFSKMCKDQYGMEVAQYLEENNNGMTEEEFDKQTVEYMKDNLNLEFILDAIAKKEGIESDEEGLKSYVDNVIKYYGYESEEALYEQYGEDFVKTSYLNSKVLEFVTENTVYTYEKSEAENGNAEDAANDKAENDTAEDSGDSEAENTEDTVDAEADEE